MKIKNFLVITKNGARLGPYQSTHPHLEHKNSWGRGWTWENDSEVRPKDEPYICGYLERKYGAKTYKQFRLKPEYTIQVLKP